jgi:hypothetical protein
MTMMLSLSPDQTAARSVVLCVIVKKGDLPLRLFKRHTMETCRRLEAQLHADLTST